ncbi:EF-P lysine aminoacylase EpmA [Gammaproteobacteria bacterium]|nr:EF-P lysine aminoacylase EpmA [Gammaproteobacteria bacterium]
MSVQHWQPTTSLQILKRRAELLAQIRRFFAEQGVLEVETPLLGQATGTDVNLKTFQVVNNSTPRFLQTSPEFAMKRLLAQGSGAIFQICKAFRAGESGDRHNFEFTMLEWYRPGLDHFQLMDEVELLVSTVLDVQSIQRISYRELFQQALNLDPHTATVAQLQSLAQQVVNIDMPENDKDMWLDLLYSHVIEPGLQAPVFIYDYPASQAALARVVKDASGLGLAQRFELVMNGMELANGYFELTDPQEQLQRFTKDQELRAQRGLVQNPVDSNLLAALRHGLPSCAGVALGLDRLLMLVTGSSSIKEVISFPDDRA